MKTTKNRNAQRNANAISKRKKTPHSKASKNGSKKIPLKRPFAFWVRRIELVGSNHHLHFTLTEN